MEREIKTCFHNLGRFCSSSMLSQGPVQESIGFYHHHPPSTLAYSSPYSSGYSFYYCSPDYLHQTLSQCNKLRDNRRAGNLFYVSSLPLIFIACALQKQAWKNKTISKDSVKSQKVTYNHLEYNKHIIFSFFSKTVLSFMEVIPVGKDLLAVCNSLKFFLKK